ncbi:MAG TPA: SRPBCC family protein [Terriglobales bacterium]|jgi:uncharacterized protein YndB with AHSA1/START domain|nr:SRPBCC family protein [Terriglobales bacterium]
MKERSVTHSSFVILRSYPVQPEKVFAAFSDSAKKRRWFAEGEKAEPEVLEMDFRVGGNERIRFRAENGMVFTNHTIYRDILPDRRIVFSYTMSLGDKCFSSSQSTIELLPTQKGADLIFTEQAAFFDGVDGPKMREEGWRLLFDQLEQELAR